MNYHINAIQFHTLPVLLKKTQQEMAKKTGVSSNYMCRHLDDGEFRVDAILSLCNAYRLRLSLFVSTCDDNITKDIQTNETEWKPLRYSVRALRDRIERDGLSYSSIMRITGWTRRTIDGLFRMSCPLSKLIKFCNDLRFNIGDFINDSTLERIVSTDEEIDKENKRLRLELRQAQERIAMLEREVNGLRNKQNKSYPKVGLDSSEGIHEILVAEDFNLINPKRQ